MKSGNLIRSECGGSTLLQGYDTLPGEVKVYIGELTLEIYDTKQERLRVACSVVSGASAFFLARYAFGYAEGSLFEYSLSLGMLIFPWIYYRIKWRKNADEYLPPGEAVFPVNEALRKNWELARISHTTECIGIANQRKPLCRNNSSSIRGAPRCR
jgi:hypothetical protein